MFLLLADFLAEGAYTIIGPGYIANIKVRSLVCVERAVKWGLLGVIVQRLLWTLDIRLSWWVVALTLESPVAAFALLPHLIDYVFFLLLYFGTDRLLEEGSDPFGACSMVNLPFLGFAGLHESFIPWRRCRLSAVPLCQLP